ncbi:MAG TPA: sensory rhodopsin transducer [Rudaea sp.]|nr:sensory rhodopsin transducer [Rudaea sp.]
MNVGRRLWVIAEGYIPGGSLHPDDRRLMSHETACILNAGDEDVEISIFVYFSDSEPAGPYRVTVPARRTKHLRMNELDDPAPIPRDTDYASVFVASAPVVVQHTRLDSRDPALALMTTTAYSE